MHVGGASPYDVVVGHGVLDELPALLGPDVRRVALLHDGDLAGLAAPVRAAARRRLRGHGRAARARRVRRPSPTPSPSDCWELLGEAGFTRSDAVVTFGGGATTDVGGFVAATWLRGVRVMHVPTTLLGMVDAAVGGKTGINTGAGKNLVGSFHEPAGVLCDLDLLATAARGGARLRPRRGRQVRLHRRPRDPRAGRGGPGRRARPGLAGAARARRASGPGQGRRGRRRPAGRPAAATGTPAARR